jgi:hypothetical protein
MSEPEITPFEEPMNKPSIPEPTLVPTYNPSIQVYAAFVFSFIHMLFSIYRVYHKQNTCDFKE